jgi:hypothetical protein
MHTVQKLLGSQAAPSSTPGSAVAQPPSFRLHASLYVSATPPSQEWPFDPAIRSSQSHADYATFCSASRPLSSTACSSLLWWSRAERTRRPTARKSNKNVTGLSRAREKPRAQAPSHSVRWSGSEKRRHISAGTSWQRKGMRKKSKE